MRRVWWASGHSCTTRQLFVASYSGVPRLKHLEEGPQRLVGREDDLITGLLTRDAEGVCGNFRCGCRRRVRMQQACQSASRQYSPKRSSRGSTA